MKKLINAVEDIIVDSLRGVAAAHPDSLKVDLEHRIVLRADGPVSGKVGLVSGGGSGHEPLHSGYVGRGMLDAACCGEVFTSPFLTKLPRPPRPSTVVLACSTSSRTTPVTL